MDAAALELGDHHPRSSIRRPVASRVDLLIQVRVVLLDLSFTPALDIESVNVLGSLHHELAGQGIALRLAGVHAQVAGMLDRSGLADEIGRDRGPGPSLVGEPPDLDQLQAEFLDAVEQPVQGRLVLDRAVEHRLHRLHRRPHALEGGHQRVAQAPLTRIS